MADAPSAAAGYPGTSDLARAAAALAKRPPPSLAPLATLAYNYGWTWTPSGDDVFGTEDPGRWGSGGKTASRLPMEADERAPTRAAADGALVERARALADRVLTPPAREADLPAGVTTQRPVAFVCAEFGIHESLPLYSWGPGCAGRSPPSPTWPPAWASTGRACPAWAAPTPPTRARPPT